MKLLASVALGAVMLGTALVGSTAPAQARTSFGVYVGGPGYYDDYRYRNYRHRCDNYWYRRNHPRRCGYYDDYDYDDYDYPSSYYNDYYGPSFGFSFSGDRHHRRHWGHRRHHRHHRHH